MKRGDGTFVTGLAALRAGLEDITGLRHESAAIAERSADVEQLVEHDVKFHKMISELSGNQYLEKHDQWPDEPNGSGSSLAGVDSRKRGQENPARA